jgi:hypothetical protein
VKVDIKNDTKTSGLLKKTTKYIVTLQVTFSAEEKQIIKERNLKKYVIMERSMPFDVDMAGAAFDLTVGLLLLGKDEYRLPQLDQAKGYQQQLVEHLKDFKRVLERNVGEAEDVSIEL